MHKKITTCLLVLLLLPCLILSVFGQTRTFIADEAGLLSPEEITTLEEMATELAHRYNIDPVILTVDSLYGVAAQDVADDYYDNTGYREDGVLFLLAMTEREWYISTAGTVIYALTDYGVQQIGEATLPYLADGNWFGGFYHFLDMLPAFLDSYEKGSPIDGFADDSGEYYHGDQEDILYYEEESSPNFILSVFCGILAAAVTVFFLRTAMNTKQPQRTASAYMKEDSWNLYQQKDIFLYSNVTKTRRQDDEPSHSGGGSSVHRSSSGRRHGGGGGKF